MKLTYETGIATLIQFIVLGLLNIATALESIISTCRQPGQDCVGNLLSSIILYILIVGWFGIVLILGFIAQEKRSKRVAVLLICAELAVVMLAAFDILHHNSLLSLFTSIVDAVLAIWVISLAYRLTRASGGRVVRHRRHTLDKK